jgi:hypothetical protein
MRFEMAIARLLCIVVLACVAVSAYAQCKGTDNNLPIYDAAPTFVSQVKNGKLFTVPSAVPAIKVLHVWGTPYEMGTVAKPESERVFTVVCKYCHTSILMYSFIMVPWWENLARID